MEENNRIDILITRYLSGEANNEDLKELRDWTERSEENRKTFQKYKNIWDSSGNREKAKMINAEKSFNLIKPDI